MDSSFFAKIFSNFAPNLQQMNQHLEIAKKAALEAGKIILNIYNSETSNWQIEAKADNSPLTLADKSAHNKMVEYLNQTNLPILSEEGKSIPYKTRKNWNYFWMLDPLDGTKEFIKRNGEFTVNIALIHQQKPILGVVFVPVSKKMYWAFEGKGAFLQEENQEPKQLNTKPFTPNPLPLKKTRIVASRSHQNDATKAFLEKQNNPEIVPMGSSLKFLILAENKADVYPRFAPTMEWDTAAAQIILEEAGGKVLQENSNQPLVYNKENLLNPYFICFRN